MAATLCPAMLPARGKTRQHCSAPRGHNNVSEEFQKHVSRIQNVCRTQMLRAWQNEDISGKHDHVSNVAAKMCPRFAGALVKCSFDIDRQ